MRKIKAGYLLEMNHSYFITIPLQNGLNLFEIESYYEDYKMCFKISTWLCNVNELKENEVLKIYGLCDCGRLTDIRNRKLLWENTEVLA